MKVKLLPIITLLVAFTVAGCAAYFSIYGLVLIFSGAATAVIAMAASLEIGKLVMTSIMFNYYKALPFLVKIYGFLAIIALMVITSVGIYGFLSGAYQQSQAPLALIDQKMNLAKEEHERKIARLKQMDDTIASISSNYVTKRLEEKRQQAVEREQLIKRIDELDQQIFQYSSTKLETEVHIGPIIKIAEAFNLPKDQAAHYLILLFIFVFDPLAVIMTLCFNIMVFQNRQLNVQTINPPNNIIDQPPTSYINNPIAESHTDNRSEEIHKETANTILNDTKENSMEDFVHVSGEGSTGLYLKQNAASGPDQPDITAELRDQKQTNSAIDLIGGELDKIHKIFSDGSEQKQKIISKIQQGHVDI